jgi:hypothetical protein
MRWPATGSLICFYSSELTGRNGVGVEGVAQAECPQGGMCRRSQEACSCCFDLWDGVDVSSIEGQRAEDRHRPWMYAWAGFFAALATYVLAWLLSVLFHTPWVFVVMVGAQVLICNSVPQRAFRRTFAITTVVAFLLLAVVIVAVVQAVTEFSS